METAKVDIRKLQLLNDRINQCIDALTQVRLSVHGLSHTSAINPNAQLGAFGGQQQVGFQQLPQPGFPQVGFPQVGFQQPFGAGLSHSGPAVGVNPFAGIGGAIPAMTMGVNPYASWGGAQGALNPYAAQLGGQLGGLSHSGPEAFEGYAARSVWTDPLLAVKVAQTFPYAQFAVPPVVTLY